AVLAAYLVEPQQLLHFFKHQLDLPASAIDLQHICRRPSGGGQRGDEQQPPGHGQRRRRDGAPRLLSFAAWAAPGAPRPRRRGAAGAGAWARTGGGAPGGRPKRPRRPPPRGAPPRRRSQPSTWRGGPASVSRGKVAGWIRTTTSACWRTAVATLRR